MASTAVYEIIYIWPDGAWKSRRIKGAPSPGWLKGNAPKGAMFVTRYYPSRKAWRVYDLRKFEMMNLHQGKVVAKVPCDYHMTPDRDAAIMAAVLLQ